MGCIDYFFLFCEWFVLVQVYVVVFCGDCECCVVCVGQIDLWWFLVVQWWQQFVCFDVIEVVVECEWCVGCDVFYDVEEFVGMCIVVVVIDEIVVCVLVRVVVICDDVLFDVVVVDLLQVCGYLCCIDWMYEMWLQCDQQVQLVCFVCQCGCYDLWFFGEMEDWNQCVVEIGDVGCMCDL